MNDYLKRTPVVDHDSAAIRELAHSLRASEAETTAARCFSWVRDNIRHSIDHQDSTVTVVASDVLKHGTGLCYAKSHLLAALLRANGIPCGFVYQRLATDEASTSFCLHGLNAVWLPGHAWYRIDARGNRPGIATHFEPPREHLAFETTRSGEVLFDEIFTDPLPVVIQALESHRDVASLALNLPDRFELLSTPVPRSAVPMNPGSERA